MECDFIKTKMYFARPQTSKNQIRTTDNNHIHRQVKIDKIKCECVHISSRCKREIIISSYDS